jgi:hypothetical protein
LQADIVKRFDELCGARNKDARAQWLKDMKVAT